MSMSPGEKQVNALLKALPSGYTWAFQPQIVSPEFAAHTPSFVIWHPDMGVMVLEVKDWKRIEQVNSKKIRYREGTSRIYINHNPVRVARAHLFTLRRGYERTRELLKGKLNVRASYSIPWTYAAIFTHISCDEIEEWERQGAWEHGRVLGEE